MTGALALLFFLGCLIDRHWVWLAFLDRTGCSSEHGGLHALPDELFESFLAILLFLSVELSLDPLDYSVLQGGVRQSHQFNALTNQGLLQLTVSGQSGDPLEQLAYLLCLCLIREYHEV